jgi:hypothetical protein
VRLEPFDRDHRAGLRPSPPPSPRFSGTCRSRSREQGYGAWFDLLRADQAGGRSIPHAVFLDDAYRRPILLPQHPPARRRRRDRLDLVRSAVQGGIVNPTAKLLLIEPRLHQRRRARRTEDGCPQRALARRHAQTRRKFEGIHRRHMRRADGTLRDTAWFCVSAMNGRM